MVFLTFQWINSIFFDEYCPSNPKSRNFLPAILFLEFLVRPDGRKMPKNFAKIFCQKSENFSLKIRKWWTNYINCLCSKRSCGHVESNFDNPAEKVFAKVGNFFPRSPKMMKKQNFSKYIYFLKMFLWTRCMRFWHSCRNFFTKSQKLFRSFSKNDKKRYIKIQKNIQFSSKCSCEHVEWFWQPYRKCFARNPKIIIIFFGKKIPQKLLREKNSIFVKKMLSSF